MRTVPVVVGCDFGVFRKSTDFWGVLVVFYAWEFLGVEGGEVDFPDQGIQFPDGALLVGGHLSKL